MDIHLSEVPSSEGLSDTRILYSESAGRFVLTVDPEKQEAFEKIFSGLKLGKIGAVTKSPLFRIFSKDGPAVIEEDVIELKACWNRPFGGLI